MGSYGLSFSFTLIQISTKKTLVHIKRVFNHFPIKGNFLLEDLNALPDNCGAPALTEWKNQLSIFKEKRYLWYQTPSKIHYYIFFGGCRKRWLYRMWYTIFMCEFLYFSWCVIGAFYLVHVMSWIMHKCTRVVEVETREMDFQMLPFHAHLNCVDWLYLIVLPWIQGQWSCFLGRWKY